MWIALPASWAFIEKVLPGMEISSTIRNFNEQMSSKTPVDPLDLLSEFPALYGRTLIGRYHLDRIRAAAMHQRVLSMV